MFGVIIFLGLTAGLVDVESDTVCPSATDVAEQLRPIAPAGTAGTVDHARLRLDAGQLVIELTSGTGAALGERRLSAEGSCADLAVAAAVVIATWESQLHSGVSMQLRAPAEEVTTPAPPLALPTPPPHPDTAPAHPSSLVGSPPRRARAPLLFDLGAAFVASFAGSAFAPGAMLDVGLAPRGPHWAARLALTATGTRDLALEVGHASWTRVGLSLGPRYRFVVRDRWLFDLHADAVAALLVVSGSGLMENQQALSFDPGLAVGGRVSVVLGPSALFVGVSLTGWLRREEIDVTGLTTTASLPQLEVLLYAGISFGRFR